MPRHGQADEGRQLLGLAEIGVRGIHQRLALERDDALVAILVAARSMVMATWPLPSSAPWSPRPLALGREAASALSKIGIAAQLCVPRRHEVGDQEIERAVGLGLQDELGRRS